MAEPLFLTGGGAVSCKVHPVVLFQILDHYSRRNEGQRRVIGTLLGVVNGGSIELRNSFPVPHTELTETVALDQEYYRTMLDLYQRVNAAEVIVGWYATGDAINEYSVLIHDFFGHECTNPVHLLVDPAVSTGRLSIKAFVSSTLSPAVTDRPWGSQFQQMKLDFKMFEAEKVGLDALLERRDAQPDDPSAKLSMELETFEKALERLISQIDTCSEYVSKVVNKQEKPNNTIGRFLETALSVIPRIAPDQFERVFTGTLQDTMMVTYLASLTRSLVDRLHNVI